MATPRRYFPQGEIYHVFNKSILGERIFEEKVNAKRFYTLLDYYNTKETPQSFSEFIKSKKSPVYKSILIPKEGALVKFIAYCIMPDHYHLVIKVLVENSVPYFIGKIENSFTRYFNTKTKRKGPLWQSRFKAVHVETNEQLLHLTRYLHLNPTSDGLVKRPEDWEWSSYRDYINNEMVLKEYLREIEVTDPQRYKTFVEERKDYQKRLKELRKLLLEL